MTDTLTDAAPSPAAATGDGTVPLAAPVRSRSQGRKSSILGWIAFMFLLLALLGAAGYAGWDVWQQRQALSQQMQLQVAEIERLRLRTDALESELGQIDTRQSDLSRLVDRNGTDLSAVQSRVDDGLVLVNRIGQELGGGRARFELAAIEHLLRLGSDRLLLHRDVGGALVALDLADERLALTSDPALFAIREALARERAALRAVPQPDLTSATLTLSSLIERVPQMPLRAHAPAQFHSPEARAELADTGLLAAGWHRLLASVGSVMQNLVTIRRDDNSQSLRRLPPDAEAIVYQVLTLKLEGARVALLRGDTVALREELRSASAWIAARYRPEDPGVLAAQGEIERLQQLDLSPPLPEIGRSLELLRARLAPPP